MIERDVHSDRHDEFFILKFTNVSDPDYDPGEVHYATSTGVPPKRVWETSDEREYAHHFKDVSWARRFSKIVENLREYVDDPNWKVEITKVTQVRQIYDEYETAWPLDVVTMLGQVDV